MVSLEVWIPARAEMCPFCLSNCLPTIPPSQDWCMARTYTPPPLVPWWSWLANIYGVQSPRILRTKNRSHIDMWSAWLVLTYLHHHWQQLPLHQNPIRKSKFTLDRLSLPFFQSGFLAVRSVFYSHLSILRECSPPWFQPPFTGTPLPPSHHGNHLIWVDLSLMVPWASLRLSASDNKDQPPRPNLENLLIWVHSIKVIPLGFEQYVSWVLSRNPQLIPVTLTFIFD
jgi:hypothetical protein